MINSLLPHLLTVPVSIATFLDVAYIMAKDPPKREPAPGAVWRGVRLQMPVNLAQTVNHQ
jgi:hypothetical protein